jgi:hypothetical protein
MLQAVLTPTKADAATSSCSIDSSPINSRAGTRTSSPYPPQQSLPM